MSFMKSIKDQPSNYDNKDIFQEDKDDEHRECSKKFILKNQNSEIQLESSIDKCIPKGNMPIEEDINEFSSQITDNNDETVTLVYQHDGPVRLLSASEERLVNLVSNIDGGGANSLDLDTENLEYGGTRVMLLQQDFDPNGEISVVTTDHISDSQLELLHSRFQGNETIALFQGETNLTDKDKVHDSSIGNHLIHIPTSEVLDNNSIPLSLISESKGVQVLQNLDRHFLAVDYENDSLMPIALTSQDILASDGSSYSASGRTSDLLDRIVSEKDLVCEENIHKIATPIKLKPRSHLQGQVGRPKKNIIKTIGVGPNTISSEGFVQQYDNRLVTVLPRPEDLKRLLDNKQIVPTKGRAIIKSKLMKLNPGEEMVSQAHNDMHTSEIYDHFDTIQESKAFWMVKSNQQRIKKKRSKSNAIVISSTGRRPGRPRKVQTIMAGAKGPKIIHTGPNSNKNSMIEDKFDDLFHVEDPSDGTIKEKEFDFYNEDNVKKKLPPRKRGERYKKLIEELQKSDSYGDSPSEDDESPDFLTNNSTITSKPKLSSGTGKRGRPRKRPLEDLEENSGTRIIQLGENLRHINTSTSASVLVRDGKDSSDRSTLETQNSLVITFNQLDSSQDEGIDAIPAHHQGMIDHDTNISLVPQYDASLEPATIFVKEDTGVCEETFVCEYCQCTFAFKRNLLQHLNLKHGMLSPEFNDCEKSYSSAPPSLDHEEIHDNSYCCNICDEKFNTSADLNEHGIIHSGTISCQICSVKFTSQNSYQHHLSTCSELRCVICLESFESANQLEQHTCWRSEKPFVCDICNAHFITSSGLNRHRHVHTRSATNVRLEKALKCTICMADFSYQESLDAHIQTVHNGTKISQDCQINELFDYAPTTAELYDVPNENEIRDQSAVQPFLCGICDSAFSDTDLLCDHFNACHTGEQPLFCEVCSVGCVNEKQLVMHMKIHTQEEEAAAEHVTPTEEHPFVCKLCMKRFKKESEMEKHVALHNEQKKYKCNKCSSSFLIQSMLAKHMLVHSGRRPYVCDICYKGFRQSSALVRHKLWTHRLKNKNKCEICYKTFFSRSLLMFHLESHGELGKAAKDRIRTEEIIDEASVDVEQCGTDDLTCEICGKECTSLTELVAHKLSHKGDGSLQVFFRRNRALTEKANMKKRRLKNRANHKNLKTWACDICDKSFATKLTRIRHSHVHLREAMNPISKMLPGEESQGVIGSFPHDMFCKECSVRFQHKSHFVRHKLLHAGIPLFKCGICSKMFVHKSDIFRHKVMHSFMFSCDMCGRNFHKRSLYLLHKKKHLFERPFKCETCGKRFASNSNYMSHWRTHSGEKPYKCNMCDYSCAQSGRLRMHRQIHSEIKKYSCDVCNKQLSSIESVKIHKRIHTGERPHKCVECPRSFVNKGSLTMHARDHFREESYKCDLCAHKFKKEAHLVKHKLFHEIQQQYAGNTPNEVYAEHLGTPLYMCEICGRVFNKKKYLYNHHNVHSRSHKFSCTFCSKILLSKIAMRNHLLIHSGEMPHKCRLCNKEFRNLSNMKRHERIHTTRETFTCEECNSTFDDAQVLEEHKQAHLNLIMMDSVVDPVNSSVTQQLYVFDSVEESMNDAMNTTQQLLVENSQQQFLVDGPQSVILFPENSNTYVEVPEPEEPLIEPDSASLRDLSPHETESIEALTQLKPSNLKTEDKSLMKPHQCDICYKTFAKRQYLTKHKYRHMDVKPHQCDICGKRFAQKFEVAVHKMKHTRYKPYQCDECGKDFRTKANLINHKMKHSGEYPYMCSICHKGLSTQLQLERHVSLHTGAYPYKCSLCQKGFSMRSSLAKHLEKAHLVTMADIRIEKSAVDCNLESINAISTITDSCNNEVKREFERELEEEEVYVHVPNQYLKSCLLSETSMIENKFITSILQSEEPSSSNVNVSMADLSENLN